MLQSRGAGGNANAATGVAGVPEIQQIYERNQEATLYCGNIDNKVDEELLAELFSQCGPVRSVHIPRDKVTGNHSGFGFIEFENVSDVEYAQKIMNSVKLYTKQIRCSRASNDRKPLDIGANLYVGNLAPEIDEKFLFQIFSNFGKILSLKIVGNETNNSNKIKNSAFVNFSSFQESDSAINGLNGQFFYNEQITVSYAYKQNSKNERHGNYAERLIETKIKSKNQME
ncbi:U2 snRNP [Cryptosporidium ryanae]|uniref:U2 snRNP n=1 Tax=Cryptosporidium ryanae TaxID=515981 RepID=UPI00351A6E8C|nr:U2 snRNP [Cryptosporidium ryanae]